MYAVFELLLKVRGITAADFCRDTGIEQSTISNWKTRGNYLKPELAFVVADYFGVSLDYLMRGKLKDGSAPEIKKKEIYALIEAANKAEPSDITAATKQLERLNMYADLVKDLTGKINVLAKDKNGKV